MKMLNKLKDHLFQIFDIFYTTKEASYGDTTFYFSNEKLRTSRFYSKLLSG